MKTKRTTKFVVAVAGSLLAVSAMQAQTKKDSLQALNKNAISLITPGEGGSKGGSGFWGYAFGDYSFMAHGDSAGRGTKQQYKGLGQTTSSSSTAQTQAHIANQNAFEIRRAYLGYDMKINSKFSASALLAYEGDQDVNDNRTVFMKYFYFRWKNIWKNTDLKVGQQATNSFANAYNTEPLTGYRSVEKTIMDMHGVDGSSDMGITLEGRIWTHKGGDSTKVPTFIGYSAMVGDNSGNNPVAGFTNSPATSLSGASTASTSTSTSTTTVPLVSPFTGKDTTINGVSTYTAATTTKTTTTTTQVLNPFNVTTDRAKKFRGNIYVNCLNTALTVGAYADYINYGDYYYGTATGYQHSVMTTKAYAVYNSKWFGIGGEWFMQTYKNGEIETTYNSTKNTSDTADAEQTGMSVFAHATIIQNCLNIFARYDMYTADNKYSYNYNGSSTLANHAAETFTEAFSNTSTTTPYKETFFNVGLDWTPTKDKRIHLMPNVWMYQIKNGYGSGDLASDNYMLYRVTFLFGFN